MPEGMGKVCKKGGGEETKTKRNLITSFIMMTLVWFQFKVDI